MNRDFKICTVVQGKTLNIFLKNLKKTQTSATMLELRADSISELKLEDVSVLEKACKNAIPHIPTIFTFRNVKEGGLYRGTKQEQLEILKKAFDSGFTYIDVSIGNPIINELTAKEKKRLILSWHDFNKTPHLSTLNRIFEKMRLKNPAIIKIASMVNEPKDIVNLSLIMQSKRNGEKVIVIGMGEKGKSTRLSFPRKGSYITYVTMKGEKSIAPGMMTESQLRIKNHELQK